MNFVVRRVVFLKKIPKATLHLVLGLFERFSISLLTFSQMITGRSHICMVSHWCLQQNHWSGIKFQYKAVKSQECYLRVGRCLSRCSFLLKFCPQYAQKTILPTVFETNLRCQGRVTFVSFQSPKKTCQARPGVERIIKRVSSEQSLFEKEVMPLRHKVQRKASVAQSLGNFGPKSSRLPYQHQAPQNPYELSIMLVNIS